LSGNAPMAYSEDGQAWVASTFPAASEWRDAAHNGSRWVVIARGGQTATSIDGVTWTTGSIGFGTEWMRIESNGLRFVAVQAGGSVSAWSADGLSWTSTPLVDLNWRSLAWVGTHFLATGASNSAARSFDGGQSWTVVTMSGPFSQGTDGIAVARGIAVSAPGTGFPGAFVVFRFGALSSDDPPLSLIVGDLCERAGLEPADFDVSSLTQPVHGYAIGRQMSVRAAIEPLQRAFYFDAVESANQIAFRNRGGAPVGTIAADDLAAASAGDSLPDDLSISRQQEVELPSVVSVVYVDVASDYQQNAQQAQRITTLSTQSTSVELAIAMSADQARGIAETLMYDAWTQRVRYQFRTSREYAALEPSDVVTLQRNGTAHVMRLMKKTESRSGVIAWEAVSEEASVYTQSATGGAGAIPDTTVRAVPATIFHPLDGPTFRDADNELAILGAACGPSDGWRGAVIYRSLDGGSTFDESLALTTAATMGYASTALATTPSVGLFDGANTVIVSLYAGALSGTNENAVIDGANLALLGSEVIGYRTATLIDANTYRLSGLLRGRYGTEWAIGTHVAGERFTVISSTALRKAPAELNAARLFKAVSIGRTVQETASQSFTYTGVNLRPYAPANVRGGRASNGDVTLTWSRSSRLGLTLPVFYDPPLGEASESYQVEWLNSAFNVVRRTTTGLITPTTTYTRANQIADGSGADPALYYRIFQMSATVGRGYARQGQI